VVTPVYNGEAYLAEAMESVQAQTYPNLVHVILDNASTDRTAAIIESFRGRKVPLIAGRNAELLAMDPNWNASLKLVPPEAAYFSLLCADDTITPDAIARCIDLAKSDPEITTVISSAERNGEAIDLKWPRGQSVFDARTAMSRFFTFDGLIVAPQLLVRTDMLAMADPFFPLDCGMSSDLGAALRTIAQGKLGVIHEALTMNRVHEGSVTQTESSPTKQSFCDWLVLVEKYGPQAFDAAEYRKYYRRYRRYHIRRLLAWRWKFRDMKLYRFQMERLSALGATPSFPEIVDAAVDQMLLWLKVRPDWYGYPA
jgi:glycosyltransferase involved in cell wall biosynthesis